MADRPKLESDLDFFRGPSFCTPIYTSSLDLSRIGSGSELYDVAAPCDNCRLPVSVGIDCSRSSYSSLARVLLSWTCLLVLMDWAMVSGGERYFRVGEQTNMRGPLSRRGPLWEPMGPHFSDLPGPALKLPKGSSELPTLPSELPKGSLRLPGSSERMKGPSERTKWYNAVPCIFYTVFPWIPFKISGGQNDMSAPPPPGP